MTATEKNELVFIISLMTSYSEDYLDRLTPDELNRIYDGEMEKGMKESVV